MSETTSYFEVEKGSSRGFGIVFTIVFLLIAILPYIFSGKIHYWAIALAGVFGIATLAKPSILEPLNTLWFKFGMLLGAIIAPIVMMLIYFLVVTPIGLLLRLFGKDTLRLKQDVKAKSYWIERTEDESIPNSMKNQF